MDFSFDLKNLLSSIDEGEGEGEGEYYDYDYEGEGEYYQEEEEYVAPPPPQPIKNLKPSVPTKLPPTPPIKNQTTIKNSPTNGIVKSTPPIKQVPIKNTPSPLKNSPLYKNTPSPSTPSSEKPIVSPRNKPIVSPRILPVKNDSSPLSRSSNIPPVKNEISSTPPSIMSRSSNNISQRVVPTPPTKQMPPPPVKKTPPTPPPIKQESSLSNLPPPPPFKSTPSTPPPVKSTPTLPPPTKTVSTPKVNISSRNVKDDDDDDEEVEAPKRTFVPVQRVSSNNNSSESDSGISSPYNIRHYKPKFGDTVIDFGGAPPVIQNMMDENKPIELSKYASKSNIDLGENNNNGRRLDVLQNFSGGSGFKAYISSSEERDESLTNSKRHFTCYRIECSENGKTWTVFRRMNQFEKLKGDLKRAKGIRLKTPKKKVKNVGNVLRLEQEEQQIRLAIFIKFIEDLTSHQPSMSMEIVQKFFRPNQLGDIKSN